MERLDRRDSRFIAVCLLVIAAGAAITSAALPARVPRGLDRVPRQPRRGARRSPRSFLAERGRDVAGARFAGQFDVDETPRSTSSASSASSAPAGSTAATRRSGAGGCAGSARASRRRSGSRSRRSATSIGFESVQQGGRAGAAPAGGGGAGDRPARSWPRAACPRRASSRSRRRRSSRPNRTDWTFVDEKAGVRLADATVRYATTVSGDRGHRRSASSCTCPRPGRATTSGCARRTRRPARSRRSASSLTLLAMLAVLVAQDRAARTCRWRLVAALRRRSRSCSRSSRSLNELPLTLFELRHGEPALGLPDRAGRARHPRRGRRRAPASRSSSPRPSRSTASASRASSRSSGAFSLRGIQTKALLQERRCSATRSSPSSSPTRRSSTSWRRASAPGRPADVPYSDMLNTAFPWATVLLIGFLPAVSEEGISRMFSISFLDRLGAGRVLAVVVPGLHLGLRPLDVPEPALLHPRPRGGHARASLIGFAHAALRRRAAARLALHRGRALHGAPAAALGQRLLRRLGRGRRGHPAAARCASRSCCTARRGGFLPAAGLTNGDVGFVPEPPPAPRASGGAAPPCGRSRGARSALRRGRGLVLARCVPRRPRRRASDVARRRTGTRRAPRRSRGASCGPTASTRDAWRSVAYHGHGFADDEDVREAQARRTTAASRASPTRPRGTSSSRAAPRGLPTPRRRAAAARYWVVALLPAGEEGGVEGPGRRAPRARRRVRQSDGGGGAGGRAAGHRARARARPRRARQSSGYPAAEYSVVEVGTEKRPKRRDTTVVLEAKPRRTSGRRGRG